MSYTNFSTNEVDIHIFVQNSSLKFLITKFLTSVAYCIRHTFDESAGMAETSRNCIIRVLRESVVLVDLLGLTEGRLESDYSQHFRNGIMPV